MLKVGDQVIMNGKYFVAPKHKGRIFTVATEPRNLYGMQMVHLAEKPGCYAVDGLTKIQQETFDTIEKEAEE